VAKQNTIISFFLWPPNRAGHYILQLQFLLQSSSFFFPRLFSAVADWTDVYYTSTRDVALVRISNGFEMCCTRRGGFNGQVDEAVAQ